ncbi:PD-(D/E)XK nuclease domain-containing protein [Hamadaea tsunoensis]|uniref:PD-(D/E)XK nuclease domain-containing protein n=1 Tax=Hamadaea tsunoensis TaxID=53368 RepID=UPI000685F67F|nr:hypothetical protein [Hamadaea tsunoensis]
MESSKLRELRKAHREGREIISVHYACESLADAQDHPPAIACIAVANLKNGTRQAFSLADLPADTAIQEREEALFERFYEHLVEHRDSLIVHWNMNSSTYGFSALANRYRYITAKEPKHTPAEHLLYDLDDIVGEAYGENYVIHPKFYNLATLNELGLFSYLSGKDEAAKYKAGDFGAIASSVSTKARAILDILNALVAGTLRTQRSAGTTDFAGEKIDAVKVLLTVGERLRYVERELSRRHGGRPTLTISDEYDYQDLLRTVFALFFDDVRDEAWTPPYAGGAARIDFLIPALELAIEIKRSRASMTARDLGDELIVDRDRYKAENRAKHLVCLVFDYDGRLQGPRGIEADLTRSSTTEGLAVTVRIFDR